MNGGELRHRITIEQKTVTRGSYGEEVITWATYKEVWASIEPLTGREFFQVQQLQAPVDHKVTIRYQSGITADMRIKFGARYFNIKSILNREERNVELTLMCQEFTT